MIFVSTLHQYVVGFAFPCCSPPTVSHLIVKVASYYRRDVHLSRTCCSSTENTANRFLRPPELTSLAQVHLVYWIISNLSRPAQSTYLDQVTGYSYDWYSYNTCVVPTIKLQINLKFFRKISSKLSLFFKETSL